MINRIKAFLTERGAASPAGRHDRDELEVAAACLLVEAARMDSTVGAMERDTITRLVSERFSLNAEEANDLVSLAEAKAEQSSQLFGFTRTVKEQFSFEERIELIEMLWEVIYADDHVHDLESNLMRRVAGLIHVPDQESGAARKRVLARRDVGNASGA
ncbi:TerB family tellurite resistance protein [Rhodospirillaceae bacterium SYSU D60014]|uniref:tellurite resistance TerB family protein n=1 Tax=Virgifigura deserti TaxID=2268457 RepID=UPI0013C45BC4